MTAEHFLKGDSGKLLRRAFSPVVSLVRGLDGGRFDLFAPERIVDRFYAHLEAVVDLIPGHLVSRGLIALVRDDSFWEGASSRATPRVKAFCDYFRALNTQWPFASTILIMGSRYLKRPMFADLLRAMGQVQRATAARREHRAEWLRHASLTIVESLYYELVSLVYAAECLSSGTEFRLARGGPQLGFVARMASAKLPGLFEGEEGRLRNAAVHCDRWRYVPATNKIHMTDTNWADEYETSELLTELRDLFRDSMLPFEVILRVHGVESRGLLRLLLLEQTSPRLVSLENEFKTTETELRRLGWRAASDGIVRR
jgi:hypothetical protein